MRGRDGLFKGIAGEEKARWSCSDMEMHTREDIEMKSIIGRFLLKELQGRFRDRKYLGNGWLKGKGCRMYIYNRTRRQDALPICDTRITFNI